MYHHLTRDLRVELSALLRAGYSQRKAAKELGVSQSSISRELIRNAEAGESYHAPHATVLARKRRARS